MHVAILDDYLEAAMSLVDWGSVVNRIDGITVFSEPFADEDDAAARLADFDIIVGMRERTPFPENLITRLPALRLLITTGMRNLSFDMEVARRQGITVCGTPSHGSPTAELTWALILSLFRNIPRHAYAMQHGQWQTILDRELAGQTLSLLGLGKLGSQVARIGAAFNMKVIAWSPNLTADRASEHGAEAVTREALFERADILSIHLILSDSTRGLVSAEDLARMQPQAFLVNTSRGPIIDEGGLLAALRERRIAGAGIDVYGTEPLPADHPLRSLENVVLTPHTGYVTEKNLAVMYRGSIEAILAFLDGNPVNVLN